MSGTSERAGVGLVGYGLAGRVFHGMLIRRTPGLEVRAIVTRHPERRRRAAADFPDARLYESYASLLDDERIDLVVLGTPHETHAPMSIEASRRGRHVVVDKVMAPSTAEADAMIQAAREYGRLLSVFQNRRWDSDFLTVKRALEDGRIGEPYVVESTVVRFNPPPPMDRPLPWRMQARHGGGPLRDWGAHLLDQAVQLFGPDVVDVHADLQFRWPGVDVETAATCDLRFRNGVRYRVEVGFISMIGRPRWYVRGSQGALTIEGLDPQEAALKGGEVTAGTDLAKMPANACRLVGAAGDAPIEVIPGDYLAYYRNVAGAILRGEPLAVPGESAREAVRLIEAAVRSAS